MEKGRFQRFCDNVFWVIALILTALLFGLNFWYSASISYDTYEHITATVTAGRGVWFGLLGGGIIAVTALFGERIKRFDTNKLFIVFAAVYVIMGAYLIFNVESGLRSDPVMVFDAAKKFLSGDMSYFEQGKYLHSYPHQTGLMLYNAILGSFGANASFNFTVNLVLVIFINYITVNTARLVFGSGLTERLTLIISFAFLPQLFFSLFVYGLVPGFFFTSLAFYYTIKLVKTGRLVYLIPTCVFSALAVILRKNCVIGVIAIAIYIFICSKNRLRMRLLAIICVILCGIVPMKLILGCFEGITGNDLDNGVPSIMWIAMGTDLENDDRAPGWYNGFNYYTYIDLGYESEPAAEIGREKLKENIEDMKAFPKAAFVFFRDKTVSMWCENTYQSVWSGPMPVCGQYVHTELLNELYTGGEAEKDLAYYCEAVTQLIWMFSLVFLIFFRKKRDGWQLAFLYFTGGLLFHTVWEGKSQYVYPYVYCLIPYASFGLSRCARRFEPIKNKAINAVLKKKKEKG